MILRLAWLVATLVPYVFGDVKFSSPAAGDTVTGPTISIAWDDSGTLPKISDLASYQLFLCAGGNDVTNYVNLTPSTQPPPDTNSWQIQLATLVTTGDFTLGNSATGTITAGLGASVNNAYFLKIISAATGGSVINFSDRFSISGMTGVFPAAVTDGLKTVSGTAGPPTQNNIQAVQAGAGAGQATVVAGGQYTVAYTLQTDPVRYAPMPPMAVSKISAKGQSRQWPTSAYTVYPAPVGTPNAITTNTMTLTFIASSMENTVCIHTLLYLDSQEADH